MTTSTFNAVAVTYATVYGGDATYATARTTSAAIDGGAYVGQDITGVYHLYRVALKFNTAAIPDGDTITQVNLKLACPTGGNNAATAFNLVIKKYNWSASDPLGAGTQEAIYDGILAATADDNIWRSTSGMSEDTYYTSGNLSTAWVSKTGSTYYGLISSRDVSNTTPTGNEFITIDLATKIPQLVVIHAAGGPANVKSVNGLAIASVKSYNGLAIASVKNINGLA